MSNSDTKGGICKCCQCEAQSHVHEIQGSVGQAEGDGYWHNHRFATVSTEVILTRCGGHKHAFLVNTDFFDHHHEVSGETGPAIDVGNGKHVHFASGRTTDDEEHRHEFQFATMIENPLLPC